MENKKDNKKEIIKPKNLKSDAVKFNPNLRLNNFGKSKTKTKPVLKKENDKKILNKKDENKNFESAKKIVANVFSCASLCKNTVPQEPNKNPIEIDKPIPAREILEKKATATDVDMLRDSLGYLIAAATDAREVYDIIRSIDKIISYEKAMLKLLGRYQLYEYVFDGKYNSVERRKIGGMRNSLINARNICQIATGDWKDSMAICSNLFDDLLNIAVIEGLITLNNTMFNPTLFRSDESRNLGQLPSTTDIVY